MLDKRSCERGAREGKSRADSYGTSLAHVVVEPFHQNLIHRHPRAKCLASHLAKDGRETARDNVLMSMVRLRQLTLSCDEMSLVVGSFTVTRTTMQ